MKNPYIDQAAELAPLIERVHGEHHPELTRVRELTEAIVATDDRGELTELFTELRTVTSDYTLPADACEAYTGAYENLKAADEALSA